MSFITGSKVSVHCFKRAVCMGSSEQDLLGDLLNIFFIFSVEQSRKLLSTFLSPVMGYSIRLSIRKSVSNLLNPGNKEVVEIFC